MIIYIHVIFSQACEFSCSDNTNIAVLNRILIVHNRRPSLRGTLALYTSLHKLHSNYIMLQSYVPYTLTSTRDDCQLVTTERNFLQQQRI